MFFDNFINGLFNWLASMEVKWVHTIIAQSYKLQILRKGFWQ